MNKSSKSDVIKDTAQVADSYEKLYNELPTKLFKAPPNDSKKQLNLKQFLTKTLPASERKEIDGEFKKTLSLRKGQKVKGKKKVKRTRKGQYLTANERRKLGLNRLPKRGGGLEFNHFHEVHDLWLDYMRKVIGFSASDRPPTPKEESSSASSSYMTILADEQLQMRVSRADYHGAFVKVTRAANTKLVGLEGYVAMETRNTFQILSKDSVLKIIPKTGSAFTFCVDQFVFTVEASNMCIKPSERAVKKWKTKPPLAVM